MQRFLPDSIKKYISEKLPYNTLRYRFARGVFWTVAGNATVAILAIVLSILVARLLGREGFGELAMIRSTVEIFGIFAGFGLGLTATKYISEFKIKDEHKAGRIIGVTNILAVLTGFSAALLLMVFAKSISNNIINAPHLTTELRISAILLFFSTIGGAQYGSLAGFEAFKIMAINSTIVALINFLSVLLGTYYLNLKGSIYGYTLASFIGCGLNYFSLKSIKRRFNIRTNYKDWKKEINVLWKFSIPSLLSNVMTSPIQWIINTIMVNTVGGYSELGLFNAANQWRNSLLIFPRWMGQTVTPILSDKYGVGDKKSVRRLVGVNLLFNMIIVIPFCIAILFGKNIIMDSYGKTFIEGNASLLILAMSAVLLSIQMPLGHTIAASGKMWIGFVLNGIMGCTLITVFFFLRSKGSLGLSYAYLIAYFFHIIWTILLTRKIIKYEKQQQLC